MFSRPVSSVMRRKKLLTAGPDTTVAEAARLMKRKNVGAVLVVHAHRLVGIFTERDAVFRVVAKGRDPKATRLSEVMTPEPKTVTPLHSFGYALLMMFENGFRHAPVLDCGRPVGIVSARHALDPDLEEFSTEQRRREHLRKAPAVA